jgi:hypothetical protein
MSSRRVVRYRVGDTVVITNRTSNASLNLYQRTKQKGMSYIHCPCNAKAGMLFTIVQGFENGFILKHTQSNFLIVAHPNDIQGVKA